MIGQPSLFQISFEKINGEKELAPPFILWQLIRSYKVNIFSVRISRITKDFLLYMKSNKLSTSEKSDFMAIACRLIYYKSKTLLPNSFIEEKEEIDRLPLELVEYLLEYKKYQMAAYAIQELEENAHRTFSRTPIRKQYAKEDSYDNFNIQTLFMALNNILKNKKESIHFIDPEEWNIEEITKDILFTLEKSSSKNISFLEYIISFSITKAVVSFISILELAKNQKVSLAQEQKQDYEKEKMDIVIQLV